MSSGEHFYSRSSRSFQITVIIYWASSLSAQVFLFFFFIHYFARQQNTRFNYCRFVFLRNSRIKEKKTTSVLHD